jgi:NAD(P)-dependent dehydrogenase (short-subunit alcohol dehydrogenase family)
MEHPTLLANKRVVVIGGSSGIGFEVAKQAGALGANLVVVSSQKDRVQQAVTVLGGKAEGYTLNVLDELLVSRFFEQLGSFDHLVYTAGDTLHLTELANADIAQAKRAFDLRYWGMIAAVKHASGHINKGGSIVLTTGAAGRRPNKGWVFSASVCGTIEAVTRALAVELAPLRVNAVCPGVVRTDLWKNMSDDARSQLYQSVGDLLLFGRVGEAHEIALAYLFLMQEGFSTGQTVVVDGGTMLV